MIYGNNKNSTVFIEAECQKNLKFSEGKKTTLENWL